MVRETSMASIHNLLSSDFFTLIYIFKGIFFLFFKKIIYASQYTVAVFRHSRRGYQILSQMVVSYHVLLGIELRTSPRAVSAPNCWAISPSPTIFSLLYYFEFSFQRESNYIFNIYIELPPKLPSNSQWPSCLIFWLWNKITKELLHALSYLEFWVWFSTRSSLLLIERTHESKNTMK